jgi:glyoxylase-like metal-dependent hydrolase (beta-lactamase superfamily II)
MNLGNWQLDGIDGGRFWLDGGVMFGVVPKTLWQGVHTPDEQNRIPVANRCVLARDGRHTVLIDTGYGGKHDPLDRKFYQLDPGEPLLVSLERMGVSPNQVDVVVLSHLHFDHAGGATRRNRAGELVPTFPHARHLVCGLEWEDALAQTPELKTAYPIDNLLPLRTAGLIELFDGHGTILPGLRSVRTGGHTRGHVALIFESNGQTAAYLSDICPSTAHLRRLWCLSYDLYPLETRRNKPVLLGQAADEDWSLLWNHDPAVATSRVARHPRREFVVVEPRDTL